MANYDMEDAIDIAEKFLQEHHDTLNLKSADLQNDVWYLIFDVGFLSEQFKEVKVDAKSGKILGYTDIGEEEDDEDDEDNDD